MLGSSVPLIIVLALATAGALALVAAFGGMPGVTRAATRSFWCPVQGRNVTAGFAEQVWDGKLISVNRCSAFTPSTAIGCDKACLRMKRLQAMRRTAVPA
ncbi:MAG: hypothetical protein HYV93_18470 [Candidatus Rokubacteria bacterium]|nr:hypothetical protein [Candidatus Rokubacteria bacterium]